MGGRRAPEEQPIQPMRADIRLPKSQGASSERPLDVAEG